MGQIIHRLGRGLISAQPETDGGELDEGEEVSGVFLIKRRNATTVLDPVEEPRDVVSMSVEVWAEADWITPIPTGRNVRPAFT